MALFRRRTAASGRQARREDTDTLVAWAAERRGIEAFVEPSTAYTPMTMLLVAHDGEFIRRPVESAQAAGRIARQLEIPVYDTNRVGYPKRMREYAQRKAAKAPRSAPVAPRFDADAVRVLALYAGVDPPPRAGEEDLRRIWKTARSRVHPDRNDGDRAAWDAVEDAAKVLGLSRPTR